jgi:hypothetical protein
MLGACIDCPPGTYKLEEAVSGQDCTPCNDFKMTCDGKNQIYPKANFWRGDITSDYFIPCREPGACIGR